MTYLRVYGFFDSDGTAFAGLYAMSNLSKNTSRQTVLVVEDESVARKALVNLLTSTGYNATGAGSAEEALSLLQDRRNPAIVLVDLNLPGMDGLELIDQMRKRDETFLGVVITAAGEAEVVPRATASNVRYLPKPLDYSRLIAVLSENVGVH